MSRKILISVFVAAALMFGGYSPALAAETTIRTDRATSINAFDAVLEGFVDTNDDDEVVVWFEWDTSSSRFRNKTPELDVGSTNGKDLSYTLGDLEPDTKYYFRAVAENEDGDIIRGESKNFTTDEDDGQQNPNYDPYAPCYPTYYNPCQYPYQNPYNDPSYYDFNPSYYPNQTSSVITLPAGIPNDTAGSVVLNGYVDTRGENTVRWFEWGTNRNYLPQSTIAMSQGNISSEFNQFLSGLQPNTTYYFRAVAQGRGNPSYGQVLPFSVRGYVYPPAPTYVPPTTPINVPVTTSYNVQPITIPIKINPVYEPGVPELDGLEDLLNEEGEEVPEEESLLPGAALFGVGFFPDTLIGWLFLIFLVVLLVYVAQKAFARKSVSHSHTTTHSHPTTHSPGRASTSHEF